MKKEDIVITNNEFLRQFEANIDDELVIVEYSQQERKIFLTKLKMSEEVQKNGQLEDFLSLLLGQIQEGRDKVVPTSPEIAGFMRKHRRKYKDLLPVGMNI
jgi:hypothetical protein